VRPDQGREWSAKEKPKESDRETLLQNGHWSQTFLPEKLGYCDARERQKSVLMGGGEEEA